MSARAGILITGTEVLHGIISDRNGPWLSERLSELGVDLAHITIVGDRPEDMLATLRFLAAEGVDVVVTSGGLGPTADDLTAEVVGGFCGREMALDEALEGRIAEILRRLSSRWPGLDPDAIRAGNRKQAMVPAGSTVLEPVGTAPGLVVPPADGSGAPTVVVLPGPPRELQPMWETATRTAALRAAITGATTYRQRILRLYGIPESEIAETLRAADREGLDLDGLEITTCLRRSEIEVATRYEPERQARYDALARLVGERHRRALFSTDGSTIDDQVAALLRERGLTLATAESCTGGLLAARLTDRAGSSEYVAGGMVVYSDEAKVALAGVDPSRLERSGAVSPDVAAALAHGAASRLGADIGVGITGIAGPGGATPDKPVGRVCIAVARADGPRIVRSTDFPGDRATVRDRATTAALHLARRLLLGEADAAP